MSGSAKIIAFCALLAIATGAHAAEWSLETGEKAAGPVLTLPLDGAASYRFVCRPDGVEATQTAVTKLVSLQSGQPIGDAPDAVMPPGAAMMAVYGGNGEPRFVPAAASHNPAGGWNLTVKLGKNDPQWATLLKGEMMSLFTTGTTTAVPLDAAGRRTWGDFLKRCRA